MGTEALSSATGQRAADLRAHLGWADFLRTREGASGLDPAAHYRKALAEEPANVQAHAMWGHYLMVQRGPIAEARQHFEAAITSGREREYVRGIQFAAMLYFNQTEAALWLYPENGVRADRRTLWRFYAGVLEEASGEKAAARSRFERLQADLDREGGSGPLKDEVQEAMQRLGGR